MGLSGKFAFWDHENEGKKHGTTFYVVFLILNLILLHRTFLILKGLSP
jgi:hypothetical protein